MHENIVSDNIITRLQFLFNMNSNYQFEGKPGQGGMIFRLSSCITTKLKMQIQTCSNSNKEQKENCMS